MTRKFSASHAVLLGLMLSIAGFITWSAVSASSRLNNLIVVVPVAIAMAVLTLVIVIAAFRRPAAEATEDTGSVRGDLMLLAGFAVFCLALTGIGFDVATFLFIWGGVVMSGGKGWWQPPLFAALFTILLVKGFGSLFPYPMLTLVL
ncbi:tripartite tricarboxylate transporter TctB family protein [Celeribacter indicus]|uniref:DUF1468 domain-containing protein n=1 Tax=Celeribacter indicus TaxID=1208324 RepID=A0A0B5DY98_9RHOB|nr:tripartite tricarboxylate transporter TctB family protein [Celeribacter indicus]AJE48428.1 hypothetical protein P73_3713 [Celeribacter indicus]SDX29607.1 Tripartite tricarboxylate transporter TctB family protein [Celeribacter indicus]